MLAARFNAASRPQARKANVPARGGLPARLTPVRYANSDAAVDPASPAAPVEQEAAPADPQPMQPLESEEQAAERRRWVLQDTAAFLATDLVKLFETGVGDGPPRCMQGSCGRHYCSRRASTAARDARKPLQHSPGSKESHPACMHVLPPPPAALDNHPLLPKHQVHGSHHAVQVRQHLQ